MQEVREAADTVAERLFAAEAAIDMAINEVAALVGSMPVAQQRAHLHASMGQSAIEKSTETMMLLTQARRGICETHERLAKVQKRIGLGAVSFGDWVRKMELEPEDQIRAEAERAIRIARAS